VRGLGLIVGIELKEKVAPYLADLAERGVLALAAGMTVIRLLPPLVITREQLDRVILALNEVLR
jgi:acetylornithine/LysW-gamma-L-lysine aminotransferase